MKRMIKTIFLAFLAILMGSFTQSIYSDSGEVSLEDIIKVVDEYINDNNNKVRQEHLLIQAILKNNLDDVKKAVESGAHVNFQQDNKNPLFIGIDINEIEEKEEITDLETFFLDLYDGITPLELAIMYDRNADIIKYLLEAGAKPNLSDKNGFTPLMFAVLYNDNDTIEIADLLVQYGAKINTRNYMDEPGYTAFYYAFTKDLFKLMDFLLKNGANINMKYEDGFTLLNFATNGAIFDLKTGKRIISMIRWLLEHKADPNIANDNNMTPLANEVHVADNDDDPTVTNLLLKYGANPNVFIGDTNKSVLMEAIDKKYVNIIEALLEGGANPYLLSEDYRIKLQELRLPKHKKESE